MHKLVIVFIIMVAFIPTAWADKEDVDYPWLDTMHQSIADSAENTALWFDEFFILDEFEHEDKASGEARIKLGWEPRSRDFNEFETRFKLRVKLPNLKNRVDVVLSDYDDEQPDSPIITSGNESFKDRERFSLALRWRAKPNSGLSHRIGVGRRLQVFAKSRYRSLFDLSENAHLRWETSVYYYSRDGFGANFSWLVDYSIDPESLLRLNNSFYFRDNSDDWLWQHSLQNLKQLNDRSALIYGLYVEGVSKPNYRMDEYLVSVRWRKNALREWLFYELEPFILWRRDEMFAPSYGLALRVEGFFGH